MSMKDLKDLAQSFLGNIEQKKKDRSTHFEELLEVVEDTWKDKMVNLGYNRGTLQIGVNSSVSYQEISQFYKKQWLLLLKEKGSKIKDIKIKLIDELGDQCE